MLAPAAAQAFAAWRRNRDDASREAVLEAHLPLVKRVLGRMRVGLPPQSGDLLAQDLAQAGAIGLIQALDGFREDGGAGFETYASIRIRGAMLDELRRQDWLSKQSRHRLKELQKGMRETEQALGHQASDDDLAAHLGLSRAELQQAYHDIGPSTLVFLEGLGPEEGQGTWAERLADPRAASPDGAPQREELKRALVTAIQGLPANERQVLELLVLEEIGHKEVAVALGVSPSRISQIYGSAVLRLQARLLPLFG